MSGALPWVLGLALHGRARAFARLGCWSVLELAPAYLSGIAVARALDDGFLAGQASIGVTWLAVLAVGAVLAAIGTHRSILCLADIVEPVRDRLMEVVVVRALREATASQPGAAAAAARATQQTEIVREALAGTLSVFRGFGIATVAVVAGLASLRPGFVLVVGPPLLIALIGLVFVVRAQVAAQRAQILAEERIAESAHHIATGLRDVVACGAETYAHRLVGRHVDAHAEAAHRSARVKAMGSVVVGVGGWLPLALLLIVTPHLLRDGVTAGVIVGAVTYLAHALQPAVQTLVEGLTGTGAWLVTAAGRIHSVTRESTVESGSRVDPPQHFELRLCRVGFRYGPHSDPVLECADLAIPEGDHLAIAGPSGAGKSTLAGLLCGTLYPTSGEVTLGGVPLGEFTADILAAQRVAIPQEAYVFTGTLLENFTYHCGDIDASTLDAAAAAIGVAPLVARLGGYDAEVDPEALSAGERQLVALTGAYLSPARIAILDEATCHLDPAAEAQVERAFAERPGTLIVVAHRISSALRARRILVLDGRELQIGDHETLAASSPLYRELVGHWGMRAAAPA